MKSKTQLRNMAAMVSPMFSSVLCSFTPMSGREYTYLCTADLAKRLQAGDLVVVTKGASDEGGKTRSAGGAAARHTVATVCSVCMEADLPDNDLEYSWVCAKVSVDEQTAGAKLCEELAGRLEAAQRRAMTHSALAALHLTEEDRGLFLLPTHTVDDGEVLDNEV